MYLIVGASGYLGAYFIKNIIELTDDEIIATYNTYKGSVKNDRVKWLKLDINNQNSVNTFNNYLLFEANNLKVIYLAAYHHPDKVEANPKIAWQHNIIAYANFLNIIEPISCLYYASTDMVYGEGSLRAHFAEEARLKPVNLYGKHKALAEQITLTYGYNVVRYPFIIGRSLVEGKPHFYDEIKRALECGKEIELFNDSFRSALDFNNCAKYTVMLIEKFGRTAERIVNISGDETLSKYEIGLRIAEKYGLNKDLIKGISIKSANNIYEAKRPSNVLLDNQKLKELLKLTSIKLEL